MKKSLYRHIVPTAWPETGISPFNLVVCFLVVIAVFLTILETEPGLSESYQAFFDVAELILFAFFAVEYALRVYVAGETPEYAGLLGRVRYIFSLWALIDLLALLPYILLLGGADAFYLRLARLFRILRVARLGRFSTAWSLLWQAVVQRRYELFLSGIVACVLLIFSSTLLYMLEAPHQPEAFGSIPRALWWSVATLTTVGYGDVTPVTSLGKVFAGLTAIAGIGLVAMPAGILAAAFSDAFQGRRDRPDE